MVKRKRPARPLLPTQIPLDDGIVRGTDHWCEHEGVSFCHWDRWLLRLSIDEPEGLRSIAQEFSRRARRPHGADRRPREIATSDTSTHARR